MRLATEIIHQLPQLRRFARAVTGDQAIGDDCVALMLERLGQRDLVLEGGSAKVALYRELVACLETTAAPVVALEGAARHMLELDLASRLAFLLTGLEGLTEDEAAEVLSLARPELDVRLETASRELARILATDVLIIEDEFFISRDLANIVTSLGHRVLARPRTHAEARAAVAKATPGLILADVHLADGSCGVEAVTEIVGTLEVPVIFITAYPERLLTGLRPEPTFLIAKPYRVGEVKAIINQSLLFGYKAQANQRKAPGSHASEGQSMATERADA